MLHRSFHRKFGERDIVGIVAEWEGDEERSNKGGKSQILEMVLYALTGQSRAEREVELISWGQDEMWVELVLVDGEKKITIKRGRDRNNHGLFEVAGVEKRAEVQQVINELIGLNKDELVLTSFLSQGDVNLFMDLDPASKKKYLMRWLKNAHWSDREREVLDDLAAVTKKLTGLRAKLEVLTSNDDDEDALREAFKSAQAVSEKQHARVLKLKQQVDAVRAREQASKFLRERLAGLNEERDEVLRERRATAVEADLESLNARLVEARVAISKLKKALGRIASKDDPIQQLGALRERLKTVLEQQTTAQGLDGVCPILQVTCSQVKFDQKRCDSLRQKRMRLKSEIAALEERIRLENSLACAQDEAALCERTLDEARGAAEADRALARRLRRITRNRKRVIRELKESGTSRVSDLDGLLDRLAVAEEVLEDSRSAVGAAKERFARAKAARCEAEELKVRITRCELRAAALRYIAFMFGKNGIPSQEIESAFDEIENEINFVLAAFNSNLQIEFRADRELTTFEDTCVACGAVFPKGTRVRRCDCGADRTRKRRDELQLRVIENGNDEGYHMESGGGKTLVSIACRVAISRLVQRQNNSNFNVMFLDEPDAMLDRANKNAFVKLITRTLTQKFGYEQVFWVSHDTQIKESLNHVLQVVRNGDQSTTKWLS